MHLFYTGIILFLEIKNYIIQKQNLHSYVKLPKEDNGLVPGPCEGSF